MAISVGASAPAHAAPPTGPNGYAGVPSMQGLGRHYELEIVCRGPVDPRTGYFKNIRDIDLAARAWAWPVMAEACEHRPHTEPAVILAEFLPALNTALGNSLVAVRWHLSPYYSVEMSTAQPQAVLLRQRFEFAASHRLHTASLSDEENRRIFGKCNNPAGHGHNYELQVTLAGPAGTDGIVYDIGAFERQVESSVIQKLDHKHLNEQVPEFRHTIPSVENIARVIHGWLRPVFGQKLAGVTVWETGKTWCEYTEDTAKRGSEP